MHAFMCMSVITFSKQKKSNIFAAQKTNRLEVLHQCSIQFYVSKVCIIEDDIFLLKSHNVIYVYNRNNMREVKNYIPIPLLHSEGMEACSLSNWVYVLGAIEEWNRFSVLRITKGEDGEFNISPWINDLELLLPTLSVSAIGSLIILSMARTDSDPSAVSVFNSNGSLQQKIMLFQDIYGSTYISRVIQRSNGHLVLVRHGDQSEAKLMEIDTTGSIVGQYQSSLSGGSCANFADIYERIMLIDSSNRIELLDSELNLIELTDPLRVEGDVLFPNVLHYNVERNEAVCIHMVTIRNCALTIFRFIEE